MPTEPTADDKDKEIARVRETVIEEACKPWRHSVGDPPEWDSPLRGVFVAGIVYTEKLLCDLLDVKRYEGGGKDFDCEDSMSLQNILAEAGIWNSDEGTFATLASTPSPQPQPVQAASPEAPGMEPRALAALDATAGQVRVPGPRYRHKKRGTTYEVIGEAVAQVSAGAVGEGSVLVVYRSEADGKLLARRSDEFHDGRFEVLPDRTGVDGQP